jgi:hypothetical protein
MDLGGSNRSQLDQKSVLVTRMTKGSDAAAREMGSIAKSTNAMGTRPEKKSALTHPHVSKVWSARFLSGSQLWQTTCFQSLNL